jgi:HK97 family phage major capsid protein
MSIQALREQRGVIAHALNELVNKAEWNEATDQPIYDKAMAEIDAIDAGIKRINDANAKLAEDTRTNEVYEAAMRRGVDNRDAGLQVWAKWLKGGDKALNADDWTHVRNTMSTTTGSEGGFTVDSEVATSVLDALKLYGGMRSVATIIQTAGIGGMSFPTSNGTAEEGEIVAENQPATDLDVTFGTIALPVYKFSSKVITVPFELLQDSNVDIEAFIRGRMVDRLGRITNKLFTIGTGSAQPNGIVTASTEGIKPANSTAQVTAVKYESLVDLQHSVDPLYRANGQFMMADSTVRALRKVLDDAKRPIFVPGYETGSPGGAPDRLLGQPIVVNQDVPAMASDAKSIIYGDLSAYYIRDVMAVEMFRFTDSAFTKKGQVGFLAWMRSGGNLVDVGGAVKHFANSTS